MPRSGGGQAYSVSLLMNIAPIAQVRARTRMRPVVIDLRRLRSLLLSAVVLFVVFFELGHAMRSTHALPQIAAGPQTLPAQFTRAGIPYGYNAAAPIPSLATFRANPVVHHPHHSAPVSAPAVSAPAASGPVVSAPATPAPSAPAPVAPAPVHTPAPVVSQPHSAPESGGGSFDSSE